MGSSRDWAAKGAALLGIKVVVAKSFERIHRSNLIGMGILPLQFLDGEGWEELNIHGDENFSLLDAESEFAPQKPVKLMIESKEGEKREINLICRLDSPLEIDYYTHGGILPYVLRQLLGANP